MNRMILLATCLVAQISFSQMDERFYFPTTQWKSTDGYDYKELFFYPEKDTLSTVLLRPEKAPKASILYFHGSGGNITNYLPFTRPLTEAGYQVLMVDFRGYGKSSGKPTHKNIAADAQFLFEKIQDLPFFKDQEIIVYGSSIGTLVATHLAKNNQEKIGGLILDGTVASFTDIALLYAPPVAHSMIKAQADIFPYSSEEDIAKIENLPLLFIHSKEDKEVPYEQGEKVFEAANAPKTFWEYKGDHLQAPTLFPEELVSRIDLLLEK